MIKDSKILFLFLFVYSPIALSSIFENGTPDGIPPALETICDIETGSAFGLCNAYCEAMDCDSDNPNANEIACSKIKTKYQNITGSEFLPCEPRICPCWDINELDNITENNISLEFSCSNVATPNTVVIQIEPEIQPPPGFEGGFAADQLFTGEFVCATRDLPPPSLEITEEQYENCYQQIAERCAELGDPI